MEWLDNSKNDGFLWSGSQLGSYDSWLKETEGELKPIEREFLDASRVHVQPAVDPAIIRIRTGRV